MQLADPQPADTQARIQEPLDQSRVGVGFAPSRLFPTLDVYFSPRVYRQAIDHKNRSLMVYTHQIEPGVDEVYQNKQEADEKYLRDINRHDGLIHQFKTLNYPIPVDEQGHIGPSGNEAPRLEAPLRLKMLICVCMYNEGRQAIQMTLEGIYKNLPKLREEGIAPEEVGVVLVQDGVLKLIDNKKTRTFAKGEDSMINFYRRMDELCGNKWCSLEERIHTILDETENILRKGPNMQRVIEQNRDIPPTIEKQVSLMYQHLWKPEMTRVGHPEEQERGCCESRDQDYQQDYELRLFSCFKHTNGTKLSSHLWFFEGFCRYLEPEFIVLLDIGTVPEKEAIANLIRGLESDSSGKVGGVTGMMMVDRSFESQESEGGGDRQKGCCSSIGDCVEDMFYSVERAQEYEYIISHFYDKNAESTLGFLHVLPGAWSAYRYKALIKSDRYEPNLLERSYFRLILNPDLSARGHQEANMYLAEDRILSLGIYCQTEEDYYMKYIPNAKAYTDPMKDHQNLMKQRRRWINSSMYAFLYVLKNFHYNAYESSHSGLDIELKLNLSMFMALLSLFNTLISPSVQFYVIFATILQIDADNNLFFVIARVVSGLFALTYMAAVGGSLMGGGWVRHAHWISVVMAFFSYAIFGLALYNVFVVYLDLGGAGIDRHNWVQLSIFIVLCINVAAYFILLLLHLPTHPREVIKLIFNTVSYISYQGAYNNTMVAHAFCNIDDVSWGTKGASASTQSQFQTQKIRFVANWLFWNCILAFIFIYVDIVIPNSRNNTGPDGNRRIVLIALAFYGTFYLTLKAVLAYYHQIKWLLTSLCSYCCEKRLYPGRAQKMVRFWEQYREGSSREE